MANQPSCMLFQVKFCVWDSINDQSSIKPVLPACGEVRFEINCITNYNVINSFATDFHSLVLYHKLYSCGRNIYINMDFCFVCFDGCFVLIFTAQSINIGSHNWITLLEPYV